MSDSKTYQHKPDSGSVFPNDRKTEDTHADFTGSAMIGGKEYWVNVWNRESQDGSKEYLGLSFKLKENK